MNTVPRKSVFVTQLHDRYLLSFLFLAVFLLSYQKLCLEKFVRNANPFFCLLREDEEENVKSFPVVQEPAGKLLETGINTLQRTLLLKKEVEVRNQ